MSESTTPSLSALFETYNNEIKKYVTVDELNMKQVQMDLPSVRHFWVGKLFHHKNEILKLKKLKTQAKEKVRKQIEAETPVNISTKNFEFAIDSHPVMIKIDEQIIEHELLVDYLNKIENNFRSLSYDIKNLIEIVKLETT